jgi:hypothetical protein
MKKKILAIVLVASAAAVAQTAPASSPAPQGQGQGQAAPAQQTIKDPAEYNAYIGAIQQTDPAAKISGLEAFLTQYPNSVMKEYALELLMSSYQQAGNQAKMMETAQKVLTANPCNLRALALLTFTKRGQAEAGQNAQQNLAEAAQNGEKGLQCLQTAQKPADTSDADWQKLKTQVGPIFNGAVGLNALQAKDYAKAQQYLRASVEAKPDNLADVYPLALSFITANPPNNVDGLFFIARAANLAAGSPAQAQIQTYGQKQYKKYHGSEEGWNDVLAAAKTNNVPPQGFTITKYEPPTPAQQCADLLKTNEPQKMAFAEWELCLSAGKPEDAAKVWDAIKGKPLQLGQTLVVKTSPTKLEIAASSDDIDAKRADIMVEMAAALPVKLQPKEGALLDFEGTPVSYEPSPFVMQMNKGALLTKAAPTPVHKKPAVRKKPAAQ